ncbi:uncharacterized protein MELLADRAFT_58444 [Melampsora larici-populina 98AG31]|uniref:Uncharacterized protein n=1 Tax=Melampsora larici-populina (strain 98AG31 / pathotype 3-4-7) TaxID=747676 RepID=F4R3J5_MELLP|nr:uncharacterized protein MELLADRAFT_58444 [Melampsora larici-populina 98AG31]EGG12639.1 hypothetical protein MELLADRAFT_58444 [Melampsora larici-populina 98AG31]
MFSAILSEASRAQVAQGAQWLLDVMGGAPVLTSKVNYKLCLAVAVFVLIMDLLNKVSPSFSSDVNKFLARVQEELDYFSPSELGQSLTPLLSTKKHSSILPYGTMEKSPRQDVSAPSISGPFVNLHENLTKISVQEKAKNYHQGAFETKSAKRFPNFRATQSSTLDHVHASIYAQHFSSSGQSTTANASDISYVQSLIGNLCYRSS